MVIMTFRSRCTSQLSEQEGPMDLVALCFSFIHLVLWGLIVIAWKQLRRQVVYREIPLSTL
jgi:hypothetical protein